MKIFITFLLLAIIASFKVRVPDGQRIESLTSTPPRTKAYKPELQMGYNKGSSKRDLVSKLTAEASTPYASAAFGFDPNHAGHWFGGLNIPLDSECRVFRSSRVMGYDFPLLNPSEPFQNASRALLRAVSSMIVIADDSKTGERYVISATQFKLPHRLVLWGLESARFGSQDDEYFPAPRMPLNPVFESHYEIDDPVQLQHSAKRVSFTTTRSILFEENPKGHRKVLNMKSEILREIQDSRSFESDPFDMDDRSWSESVAVQTSGNDTTVRTSIYADNYADLGIMSLRELNYHIAHQTSGPLPEGYDLDWKFTMKEAEDRRNRLHFKGPDGKKWNTF